MKAEQPELTIVIPTYNSGLYIGKTLDHLVSQIYKNFSVLVIDDNSSDNTFEIVNSYKNKLKVTFIEKSKKIKKGAAASINYAFKIIDTKYWALIDSDAFLHKNWTNVVVPLLHEKQIVGAPVYAYKPNEIIAYLTGLEIESRYNNIKKNWVHHLSTCNIAGQQEIIKYINLNENLKYAYDHQLSFQLKRNGILFFLTKKTFCHHLNKSGLFGYASQQYKVAKYHFFLSKQMRTEAKEGDEISPSYLILQPIFTFLGVLFLAFYPILAGSFLLLVVILNMKFLVYGASRNLLFLPVIILIIFIKNIAWIIGSIEGLFSRELA